MNTVRFRHCTVSLLIAAAVLLQAAVSHAGGKVAGKQVPWGEEDTVAAATAIDRLQIFLLNALKDERGVHAETLLTAVGALAGFSAQHTIWKTVVAPGKMPIQDEKDHNRGAFIIVKDANGEHYFFGDLLNSYIVPQNKDGIPLGPRPLRALGLPGRAGSGCRQRADEQSRSQRDVQKRRQNGWRVRVRHAAPT